MNKKGKLISFFGPMYAGKSTSLINYVNDNNLAFEAYKPKIDNRYSEDAIQTHDGRALRCNPIRSVSEILIPNTQTNVIIDEIQFFDKSLVKGDVITKIKMLLASGNNVITGGLDKNWKGEFFEISHEVIKISDSFYYLSAKCFKCGEKADFTFKNSQDDVVVSIGSVGMYEARCIKCWTADSDVIKKEA